LQYRTWEDKDTGAKRSKVDVVADSVQFLGRGGAAEDSGDSKSETTVDESDFEDIPF
jgi:single-strand DNA-binding protein